MPAPFGFVPVTPPLAGAGQDEQVVAGYLERLRELGGERRAAGNLGDPAPLVYVMATGGTEGALLALHEERQAAVQDEPALLIAHPGNNSLPAALEVLARLQQDGAQGEIVFLRGPDDWPGLEALQVSLQDMRVRAALRSARIGLVGAPSDWLVASSPDPAVVADVWGPEVVELTLADLTDAMDAADDTAVAEGAESLAAGAVETLEPETAALAAAARVHAGLKALVSRHELNAVSVRCFDLLGLRGTTGCFALSELTDEGIIAGCEGDLVSTLGLLWVNMLTGGIPWMANPADLDEAANTLVLAHCTVPRTMVDSYRLRSHFESGLGVGIQATLPLGPVTLLRIGGSMLDALWLAEGEAEAAGSAENLCRTQIHVRLSRGDVGELLSAPLGNHIVMVYGHHAERLARWWETML